MPSRNRSTVLAIFALLAVFGGAAVLALSVLLEEPLPGLPGRARVAVVPVEGAILTAEPTLRAMRSFREDASVRAFVLEIRSPGGTVGASQSLYRDLRRLRQEDERPVVAWIGDVGASGGYYVALAADSIFALPGSITGSIGVVMEFPDLSRLAEEVGVDVQVVKSGELKDAGSLLRPLSEEERRMFRALIEDSYGQFVDAVAENRPLERDRVLELADGSVYSGERAVELGLVDGLATLSETVERAGRMAGIEGRPHTVRPSERRLGILELLRGVSESRLGEWIGGWTGGILGAGTAPRLLYRWR